MTPTQYRTALDQQRSTEMTKQVSYKGLSIELETNGTYSIYSSNPYATKGGFKSTDEAKTYINKNS